MKTIELFKNGKPFKKIPWTAKDEAYFKSYEGYMVADGMSFSITGGDDTLNIPQNSFVATFSALGRIKTDSRSGENVRWAKAIVKVSSMDGIAVGAELWVKIAVSQISIIFTRGLPHDYIVINPQHPGRKQWIHRFETITPYDQSPTTTVTTVVD